MLARADENRKAVTKIGNSSGIRNDLLIKLWIW